MLRNLETRVSRNRRSGNKKGIVTETEEHLILPILILY